MNNRTSFLVNCTIISLDITVCVSRAHRLVFESYRKMAYYTTINQKRLYDFGLTLKKDLVCKIMIALIWIAISTN